MPRDEISSLIKEASIAGWYLLSDKSILVAVNPGDISEVWTLFVNDGTWRRKGEPDCQRLRLL